MSYVKLQVFDQPEPYYDVPIGKIISYQGDITRVIECYAIINVIQIQDQESNLSAVVVEYQFFQHTLENQVNLTYTEKKYYTDTQVQSMMSNILKLVLDTHNLNTAFGQLTLHNILLYQGNYYILDGTGISKTFASDELEIRDGTDTLWAKVWFDKS